MHKTLSSVRCDDDNVKDLTGFACEWGLRKDRHTPSNLAHPSMARLLRLWLSASPIAPTFEQAEINIFEDDQKLKKSVYARWRISDWRRLFAIFARWNCRCSYWITRDEKQAGIVRQASNGSLVKPPVKNVLIGTHSGW